MHIEAESTYISKVLRDSLQIVSCAVAQSSEDWLMEGSFQFSWEAKSRRESGRMWPQDYLFDKQFVGLRVEQPYWT